MPSLSHVKTLRPQNALLVCQFGDLSLVDGIWPIVGTLPSWSRNEWPVPAFSRTNALNRSITKVIYSDDDIDRILSEQPVSPDEAASMPRDGLFGAGAVEIVLTKLLT